MNYRIFTAIVLAATALAACSDTEPGDASAPAAARTRVVLRQDAPQAVSVYAFRQQGEAFLFDTLLRNGWTAEGTLSARLKNGTYKFLFAAGAGERLALQPDPPTRATTWDEAAFVLRGDGTQPGVYLPADELFLQAPASEAEKEYILAGTDVTVSARLKRVVCRIGITLKRGYYDGSDYVEVPYTAPRTVLDAIERIELTVSGAGQSVTPSASSGAAEVSSVFGAKQYTELTADGFARFEGPLILPPADGTEVGLKLSVVPAAGAALQPAVLDLKGNALRNTRFDIRLWITSEHPEIGVEIRTEPISQEQDGDSGIWE